MQPVSFQFLVLVSNDNKTINSKSFQGTLNGIEFRNEGPGIVTINRLKLASNQVLKLEGNENEAIVTDFAITFDIAVSYNLKVIAKTYVQ